jgi:hypothetical protein
MEYALRLLRRYRPELEGKLARKIVHTLIHAYPSHGFILDLEELRDLGLPARAPGEEEAPIVDALALALVEYGTDSDLIALAMPRNSATAGARRRRAPMHRPDVEGLGTPRTRTGESSAN